MALGSCDNCNRTNVPVANYDSPHGETTQCYICTACPWEKDPDPDPYGELDCEQCYGSGYLTTDEGCERECAYCGGTGAQQLTETLSDPFLKRRKLTISTKARAA